MEICILLRSRKIGLQLSLQCQHLFRLLLHIRESPVPTFKTSVLSQLSLVIQMTQSLGKRLTKLEKDVANMKWSTLLDYDDVMIEDIPPTSLGNPPPSHPPPHTPSPPLNSPPQIDDTGAMINKWWLEQFHCNLKFMNQEEMIIKRQLL